MNITSRRLTSAWPRSALIPFPLCIVLTASACSTDPGTSPGTGGGGAPSVAGSTALGGSLSVAGGGTKSGGASFGGSAAPGGSSSGGARTGSGGASLTAGSNSGGRAAGGIAGASGGSSGGATMGGMAGGMSIAGSNGAGAGGAGTGGSSTGRSPGCGKTSTLTFGGVPGESGQNVGFGKGGYVNIGNRGFAMRLPDNYDNARPYWLIFGFHWRGGNSKEVDTGGSNGYNMAHYGLQKLSNNGAIFVAPDGLNGGWGNSNDQDLKFVDDMVKLIGDNYCVDTKNIFANGFSWGGGMSYAIACSRANVFRAVAIYNGAVLSGCPGGNDPIAYWQMAGQTDTTCTIGAGRMMRDRFVTNNGCTAQSPPEPPMPPPYLKSGGHVCTTYSGCKSGYPLRWCAHQSGHGNAVVDGTADLFNGCATPPNTCSSTCPCTWVPEDVWSFFKSL